MTSQCLTEQLGSLNHATFLLNSAQKTTTKAKPKSEFDILSFLISKLLEGFDCVYITNSIIVEVAPPTNLGS